MANWPHIRLADVVQCLDSVRKPVRASERRPGPYPYYGASGVVDHVVGHLFDGTYALVAEDGENLRSRNTPVAFLARGKFWVNNHAHILGGTDVTDVRYLAYRIECSDVARFLSGSTQPKLTQEALLSMTFTWPPMEIQRTIADVLAGLDDKIAAERHTASLCEELAVAHVGRVSGRAPLRDFGDVVREQARPEDFAGLKVAHFSFPAFDAGRLPERCSGEAIKSSKFVVPAPAALVSKLNPHIPRVWCATPPPGLLSLASTEFVVVRPKSPWSAELIWAACAAPFFAAALAAQVTGTTGSHQRVRPDDVLVVPVADLAELHDAVRLAVERLVKRAVTAREETVRLAALRDALLYPLLSGELQVRDADASLREAV
jgi:type I restriction enzyme S subunit